MSMKVSIRIKAPINNQKGLEEADRKILHEAYILQISTDTENS